MKIVRTNVFKKLGASEADLAKLENELAANPDAGDVIQGLGGARKIRFAMKGKGKSGGGRAIYLAVMVDDTIFLILAYGKSKQENLSAQQLEIIREITEELKG